MLGFLGLLIVLLIVTGSVAAEAGEQPSEMLSHCIQALQWQITYLQNNTLPAYLYRVEELQEKRNTLINQRLFVFYKSQVLVQPSDDVYLLANQVHSRDPFHLESAREKTHAQHRCAGGIPVRLGKHLPLP